MPHPLLQHVQWNTVDRSVDPKAMAQALWAPVWRIRYPGLDHDPLDDLPDPYATERPDRRAGLLAGFLGFPDAVGGVEGIQIGV